MSATDLGDPNQTICIPARELTGTREAKLAELDTFLAQLHLVRLVLCGQPVRLADAVGAPDDNGRNVARAAPGARLIPERVMVCMSANPLAPLVIRNGARIAGRLGSRWYAVYVETPRERGDRINPRDADALQQNIKLAESLGATVVRVKADKPADGLIAFAQREGVTHVIFGQSARTRLELMWHGSTLDKFLGAVPDAAVQVVPLNET